MARRHRRQLVGLLCALLFRLTFANVRASTVDVLVQEGNGPHFDPLTAEVHVGDTVRWVWLDDGFSHSVVSGNGDKGIPDGMFNSGIHSFPYSFSFTFQNVGQFFYYCGVHYRMKPPGINPAVNVTAGSSTPTPTPTPTPGVLGNISTRLQVGTGNNVLFAGFIVQGNAPKKVIIRSAGPSLTPFGITGALANPRLELHDVNSTIGTNDNWQTTQLGGAITSDQVAEIRSSGAAPSDTEEPAIIATLQPGSYTAIVNGVGDTQGIATVELYDLSPNTGAVLANISTRGLIQTGDQVMIGGFIVSGQPTKLIIRATGPSLAPFGITNALPNPRLELHDANGALTGRNDNWQTTQLGGIITSDQSSAIQASGLAPTNASESAILATLGPGAYTAISQDVNGATGVGLVEVYTVP